MPNPIRKYALLIELLQHGIHSKTAVLNFLADHGFNISERTFDRYIESLRNEFGVEIEYDVHQNGYAINKASSRDYETFLHMLELSTTASIFEESYSIRDHISFESERGFKGIRHLGTILRAIKDNRVIRFNHKRFESPEEKQYELEPLLLKEFRNRWYVFGYARNKEEMRTFGLDRILEIDVSTEVFPARFGFNPKSHFQSIIGLKMRPEEKPEYIVIRVEKVQAKYLLSLPMHASQELLREEGDDACFSYFLIPNYEFYQQVLMMGTKAEILEPAYLRERFKEVIQEIAAKYER